MKSILIKAYYPLNNPSAYLAVLAACWFSMWEENIVTHRKPCVLGAMYVRSIPRVVVISRSSL